MSFIINPYSHAIVAPPLTGMVAWYRKGIGITVATGVSQWSDQSGNNRHLTQATGANQPALQGDNTILFDGVNDYLKTSSFTLVQPSTVYILGQQVAWTYGRYWFDGAGLNGGGILQAGNSGGNVANRLTYFAGSYPTGSVDLSLGTYSVVQVVFNGASSLIQLDAAAAVTGTTGANSLGGITLGAAGNNGVNGNIRIKEVIVYSVAHDATQRAAVRAYLATV